MMVTSNYSNNLKKIGNHSQFEYSIELSRLKVCKLQGIYSLSVVPCEIFIDWQVCKKSDSWEVWQVIS